MEIVQHTEASDRHAKSVEVSRRIRPEQRDPAVDELIELVAAFDGILQGPSQTGTDYFFHICRRTFGRDKGARIRAGIP